MLRRRRRRGRSATSASPPAGTSSIRTPASAATSCTSSTAPRTAPDAVDRALADAASSAREQRVRPGLDDKVLLGWNALFLGALTEAAAALDRDDWMDAARTNARFLLARAAPRRRPPPPLVAGRRAPTSSPTPRTTPRCSRRCVTLAELDDVAWLADARTVADDLVAPLPRRRARRLLHDRHRRRAAHRPAEGLPGQRDAVGELARRQRAAAARRAHRRRRRYAAAGDRWVAHARRRCSASTRPRSRTCSARCERVVHRPARDRDRRRRRRPGTGRAARRGARPRCCPASVRVAAAPGAGAERDPAARGSPAGRRPRRPRTCASTSRAGSPSPTPERSAPSSTPRSTARA